MLGESINSGRLRLPSWLVKRAGFSAAQHQLKRELRGRGLHTVCEEARCPNLGECWGRGTATFMILGNVCTRHCRFCSVAVGRPRPVDPDEPRKIAEMVEILGLLHVVVTSVARDDLPDGGAGQFVKVIEAIRKKTVAFGRSRGSLPQERSENEPEKSDEEPNLEIGGRRTPSLSSEPILQGESSERAVAPRDPTTRQPSLEILTTDFQLNRGSMETVCRAKPDIFNHNIETVERLTPQVRHRATYRNSLEFLRRIKQYDSSIRTKSGLMVGLGEKVEEVVGSLRDLRGVGCEMVTIGQYLRPTKKNLPVVEFVPPEVFQEFEKIGHELGFKSVASGPFVRSSYHAEKLVRKCVSA